MVKSKSKKINKQKAGGLSTLPSQLQVRIRRYLELGDFRTAKALYDAGLESKGDDQRV